MAKRLAKLLTWASVAACLVVIASFAIFAINQTASASARQQEEVFGTPRAATGQPSTAKEDTAHRVIDEVAGELTSPFSSITAGSSSEWVVHGVDLLCALVVYGLGLGYLARVIRVRV
ncbi:MAG TPA: hypothetical protein VEJ23_01210 [Solirubrobacteraceae bacterium]|nr:hypothetical protein [Solirubrobacteraceae bacterium]